MLDDAAVPGHHSLWPLVHLPVLRVDHVQVLAEFDGHILELALVEVAPDQGLTNDLLVQQILEALEHLVDVDAFVRTYLVEHLLHDIRDELVRTVLEDDLDVVLQFVQVVGLRQSLVKQVLLEAPAADEAFAVVELGHQLRDLLSDRGRHLRQILFCDFMHQQAQKEELTLVYGQHLDFGGADEQVKDSISEKHPRLAVLRHWKHLVVGVDALVGTVDDDAVDFVLNYLQKGQHLVVGFDVHLVKHLLDLRFEVVEAVLLVLGCDEAVHVHQVPLFTADPFPLEPLDVESAEFVLADLLLYSPLQDLQEALGILHVEVESVA